MTELNRAFSPLFNEPGFEARIDWNVSRREFAENIKRLLEELRKNRAAIPLPVQGTTGLAASLLAGIDCKRCDGLCCTRGSQYISLFPSEAARLGIKGAPDDMGQVPMSLPCKFLRKGQCSVYADRPARCRFYPVQIGGSAKGAGGEGVFVGLDSSCPEALRLGLRVYMASYDLAHGMKDL